MSDESGKPATPPDRTVDEWIESLRRREDELRQEGHPRAVASETAQIEDRIATQWPETWGEEFQALVYGDFSAPPTPCEYPQLGIRILPENLRNTVISGAIGVFAARVTVSERSFGGVMDAASRLNTLIGIWAIVEWGNRSIEWWSHITHGSMGGVGGPIDDTRVPASSEVLDKLPPNVRRKVRAALYWIREPRTMLMQSYKRDEFRMFAGYWNAFECLVEAVCLVVPKARSNKSEKNAAIAAFLAERNGQLNIADVINLYRIVDSGFVGKGSHALRVCFPEEAERYIEECFRREPRQDRLYDIRNAIDHGDIDADNLQEIMRVEGRLRELWMIVFRMFGKFLPYGAPADPGPRDW